MHKDLALALTLVLCLWPMIASANGITVSSDDLINKAKGYDGHDVIYTGEVIGDILYRGTYAWVNVSDGSNAIGVWVKSNQIEGIKFIGRYNAHGDTVKVAGIFNRACKEHGGDFDIHAQSIEMVSKGYPVTHTIDNRKVILAIFLFVGTVACMVVALQKSKEDNAGY